MKYFLYAFFILTLATSCQEEDIPQSVATPQISSRGIQADRFTFAVALEEGAGAGTFYYLVQKKEVSKPSAAGIKNSNLVQSFSISGGDLKTVSMPGLASKTTYVVYGMLEIAETVSNVAELEVTTL